MRSAGSGGPLRPLDDDWMYADPMTIELVPGPAAAATQVPRGVARRRRGASALAIACVIIAGGCAAGAAGALIATRVQMHESSALACAPETQLRTDSPQRPDSSG